MAGHVRYTALLDANVLFAAKWTARIDDEWMRNLGRQRGIELERLCARRDAMRRASPDWEVPHEGWAAIEPTLQLPDPDDRHVLAAAIVGHADAIITENLKDFPAAALEPFALVAITPDDFVVQQLDLEPDVALAALRQARLRLTAPSFDPPGYAAALERNGLVQTAQLLYRHLDRL